MFTYSQKAGNYATVNFDLNISHLADEKFRDVFSKLGARWEEDGWKFPLDVSPSTIKKILDNTCFKCGGTVETGVALQNTLVSFDDFGNDAGKRGTTQSQVGSPRLVSAHKCSSCGHSFTR